MAEVVKLVFTEVAIILIILFIIAKNIFFGLVLVLAVIHVSNLPINNLKEAESKFVPSACPQIRYFRNFNSVCFTHDAY